MNLSWSREILIFYFSYRNFISYISQLPRFQPFAAPLTLQCELPLTIIHTVNISSSARYTCFYIPAYEVAYISAYTEYIFLISMNGHSKVQAHVFRTFQYYCQRTRSTYFASRHEIKETPRCTRFLRHFVTALHYSQWIDQESWSRAWKSSQTSHVENRMRACCLWIACCSYIGCRLAIAMKSRDKATRYLFDCIIMQTKLRYNVLDRNTSPAGYTQANVSSQFSLASKASEFSSDESIIHKSVIIYKQNIDHLFEWNKEI